MENRVYRSLEFRIFLFTVGTKSFLERAKLIWFSSKLYFVVIDRKKIQNI